MFSTTNLTKLVRPWWPALELTQHQALVLTAVVVVTGHIETPPTFCSINWRDKVCAWFWSIKEIQMLRCVTQAVSGTTPTIKNTQIVWAIQMLEAKVNEVRLEENWMCYFTIDVTMLQFCLCPPHNEWLVSCECCPVHYSNISCFRNWSWGYGAEASTDYRWGSEAKGGEWGVEVWTVQTTDRSE